ncbi:MAG: ECF-type sigma factor [bacterium]|nr:ECF-type sigma factor [bacterium]
MSASASPPNDDQDRFAEDLEKAANGDRAARDRLWSEHYDMFRECANSWMENNWQQRGADFGISLGGTDIVNAAYARLRDRTAALEKGRTWFFRCFYTELMRIAIDHYRKTKNDKGRGDRKRVAVESQFLRDQGVSPDLGPIYDILDELRQMNERTGQVAMLKILESKPDPKKPGAFRGLQNDEVAELLGWSLRQVEQDWRFAKSYIMNKLKSDGDEAAEDGNE